MQNVRNLTKFSQATGRLARLLAQENMHVIHGNYSTASFDVENRVLRLPVFNEDISKTVYTMLVAHEVGHALFTPAEGWHDCDKDIPGIPRRLVNIVEDIRIEKLIRRRFEGLYRDFQLAYVELVNQDFLGTKSYSVARMGFSDRLNIYAKARHAVEVPFTEEERVIVDKAMLVEEWNDVLHVCKLIKEFSEKRTSKERSAVQELLEEMLEKSEEDNKNFGQKDIVEADEDEELPEGFEFTDEIDKDTDEETKDDIEEDEDEEDDSDYTPSSRLASDLDNELEDQDTEESETPDASSPDSRNGEETNNGESEDEELKLDVEDDDFDINSEIDQRYRKMEEEYAVNSKCTTLRIETSIADHMLGDIKNVKHQLSYSDEEIDLGLYNEWMKKNSPFVNKMVSEFNLRRNAHREARTQEARSGTIDPTRLAQYKFSDDLFTRYAIKPGEENHGLLIGVDVSASMAGPRLRGVFSQMMIMAEFCRKLKIPFKVYTWTGGGWGRYNQRLQPSRPYDTVSFNGLDAIVILDSTRPNKEYREMMAWCYGCVVGKYNVSMSGTPSGQAIAMAAAMAKKMKTQHKIEKLHFVHMSDEGAIGAVGIKPGSDGTRHKLGGQSFGTYFRVILDDETWAIDMDSRIRGTLANTEAILLAMKNFCETVNFYGVGHRSSAGVFMDRGRVPYKYLEAECGKLKGAASKRSFFISTDKAPCFDNYLFLPEENVKHFVEVADLIEYDVDGNPIIPEKKDLKEKARATAGAKQLCASLAKFIA